MIRTTLLALAVILAGCPALDGEGATATVDVTPAPVPADRPFPPGVGMDGVAEPAELARAHTAVVENASYTLSSNRTIRAANGSLRSLLDVTTRLARDRTYLVSARTAGPEGPSFLGQPPASAEFWSNGSVYLRALRGPNGTVVNRFQPPDNFVGTWRYWRSTVPFGGQDGHAYESLVAVFRSIPTTVVNRETTETTTRLTLVGREARSAAFAKAGRGPITDVRLEAVVREDGLVESMDLTYIRPSTGGDIRVDWSLRYETVGSTTVGGPPWPVPPARSQASSTNSTSTPS